MTDEQKQKKVEDFVRELYQLRVKFGLRPTEVHVNPNDEFLVRFAKIGNLKVVHDLAVPVNNLVVL